MFDLTKFSLQDMSEAGDALQQLELKAKNIDELSDMIVRYFFDNDIQNQLIDLNKNGELIIKNENHTILSNLQNEIKLNHQLESTLSLNSIQIDLN